jgi:glucose/arabinose dehydrogenase
MISIISTVIIILIIFAIYALPVQTVFAQPYIIDTRLNVEPAIEGLSSPTSMAFLDDNNLLVLEKEGNVRLVSDGLLQEEPLLRIPVNAMSERGLLGIAVDAPVVNATEGSGVNNNTVADVFLYFTEADPLRNRVYKYQWNGQALVNPVLILDLPATPGPMHNAGKIAIGPDGYLYVVIGDVSRYDYNQLQNFPDGPPPDDTGVIFRVNPEDGSAAPGNPFANSGNELLSKYYAYGVRNSFGISFDPISGNLWDTENGESSFDEINLVRPGFNSGWEKVMGPISLSGHSKDELVNFSGSHYSDPLFSWRDPVGPTDIEFFSSSKLGDKYTNNIFIGDVNRGNLYFFEVNQSRNGIKLNNAQQEAGLSDLVVNSAIIEGSAFINEQELSAITFGSGFTGITDIETGPDGLLYVLSIRDGIIYKISPSISLEGSADRAAQARAPARMNTDDPFAVAFSIAGVDNDTGYLVNWVTAKNVTRAIVSNASNLDVVQTTTSAEDGLIETSVSLPNGTMHIGDEYKACTMIPKYIYRVCDIGINWPGNRQESVSVTIPRLNVTTDLVSAQTKRTIDEAPFAVAFSVAGVGNDTGDVVSWITASNATEVYLYNASDIDSKDNRQDGFIETAIPLPNGTMHIGDKYKACTMVLKDDSIICNTGFNWPTDRPEQNTVVLPHYKKIKGT